MSECFRCGGDNDLERFGNSFICQSCTPTDVDDHAEDGVEESGSPDSNPTPETTETPADGSVWVEADFSDPESGVYPATLLEREQWMGRKEKLPFAPWGDRNADLECTRSTCAEHDPDETADAVLDECPDCQAHRDGTTTAECDHDARYKWGHSGHYVDGDRVDMAEDDPRLDGRVFLQREDDAFVFVDGDDVRCPETGDVHPEFVRVLEAFGATYADVSTSGSGAHANYRGELPDGVKQATFAIDTEPWGQNDDLPEIEIYDGKHVCVTTGEHVPGAPTDVRAWDDDAVEKVLDEFDQLPDETPSDPAAEHDAFDTEEYDAEATGSDETTTDVRDIFAALDRLDARRVAEQTIVHTWNDSASTSGAKRAFAPTWGPSAKGTANVVDREIWQDTGGGGYGGPVVMALVDAGEVRPDSATPRVTGETWWKGIDHLRSLGFDIPEYESDDVEHTAVLPPAVRDLSTATSGWDWKHAAADDGDTLSISDARERTVDAIAEAYESYDHRLIEALPTMGKSYGAVKAAAQTGEPVTILTGRGRKEQYAQFKEWADEFDLDVYSLPAFTHDCDTANGEHGDEWQETVRDWYRRGATPKEIHKSAEYVLGEPLPCQRHEGQDCPYTSKWDFDPDEFDILLGHYTYAHKSKVTAGRTVVFDEFPDAYEETLGATQRAISYWLSTVDGVPFEDYTDLRDGRDDQDRRADALLWFEEHGVEADEQHVFDDASAHADAPLAVYTLLAGEDLGNGFEAVGIDDVGHGVYNRRTAEVSVLRPPPLADAPPSRKPSGVVALDGTPTKRMWELALGERLDHRPVLQQEERAEYIEHALNLNFVRSSEYIKSYNSADHVSVAKDAALLEAIAEEHGQKPALITTMTAKDEYIDAGVLQVDDEDAVVGGVARDLKHYGNVLGSNEFDDTRLGAVIGSNHYGDGYIKKWGAYAGETVERGDGKGTDLSYGGFGDDVLQHMREHDTLQAAMRFGRDGNGAVVYVHTDTLPEWVPIAAEARVVRTHDDGERQVLDAVEGRGRWTTEEIAAADGVDVTERRVRQILDELVEDGAVEKHAHPDDGRMTEWHDAGVDDLDDHVELPDFEDSADGESSGNSRSSYYYTWVSARFPTDGAGGGGRTGEPPGSADDRGPGDGVAGGAPPG